MKNINSTQPLVSVIIPVFNGATYLEEAVESVMNNTYKHIEVLLVDDGSKDTSKELCHALEKKYENVHFYAFERNRGLGRVLNFALRQAQGKLICRLNQDDIMRPERIATQVQYFMDHPDVVACGSWINMFEQDGSAQTITFLETDEQIKKIWLVISPFADPSVMYRKTAVIEAGLYQQEFWPGDDTHLWYRMGKVGKLANIQKVLVDVRYHKGAASVYHFRKLTDATYRLHRWAHVYIESASFGIQLFWIMQYVMGMVFSANFNWKAYRLMKQGLNYVLRMRDLLVRSHKKQIVPMVTIHPKKVSFSGQ